MTKAESIEFTIVVAVDIEHLAELKLSYPTWIKHKPEMLDSRILLICDGDQGDPFFWMKNLSFIENKRKQVVCYSGEFETQREKMLTALVHGPAHFVKTEWFLKIDTDTVAMNDEEWIDPSWFVSDAKFVSNPWGYTKPNNRLDVLDDWADQNETLKGSSRLNVPYDPKSNKVKCRRIISWIMFCRTDFVQQCSELCEGSTLPVPSQDTFLWYVAKRLGLPYQTRRFKKHGWTHTTRRKLPATCMSSLSV